MQMEALLFYFVAVHSYWQFQSLLRQGQMTGSYCQPCFQFAPSIKGYQLSVVEDGGYLSNIIIRRGIYSSK